jgi:hypothetical protein
MTFLGLSDGETDMDSDTGDVELPFEIFTLRNFNFLLDFGLTEFHLHSIENKTVLIIISVIVIIRCHFLFLIKQILKLSENNSFKHKKRPKYLTIPEAKSGKGI